MAADVDGEDVVPLVGGRTGQAAADGDADVEHQPVQPPEPGDAFVDDRLAARLLGDVADHDDGVAALGVDHRGRLLGRPLVAVGNRDRGSFAGGGYGDGAAVSDRGIGIVRRAGAGAHHEHPAPVQSRHPGSPSTPGSRSTRSEFRVKATRWY